MKKYCIILLMILFILVSNTVSALAVKEPTFHNNRIEFTFEDTRVSEPESKSEPEVTPEPEQNLEITTVLPNAAELGNAKVGEIVTFGRDLHTDAPAQWIVTKVQDAVSNGGKPVKTFDLLSVYVVDCEPYFGHYAKASWGKSDLRKKMNEASYIGNIRLNYDEQKCLLEKENTDSLETVTDKVWIPDRYEFESMRSIIAPVIQGFTQNEESFREAFNGINGWWLRGTGGKSVTAEYVSEKCGEIREEYVDSLIGVRPMIRIMVLLP